MLTKCKLQIASADDLPNGGVETTDGECDRNPDDMTEAGERVARQSSRKEVTVMVLTASWQQIVVVSPRLVLGSMIAVTLYQCPVIQLKVWTEEQTLEIESFSKGEGGKKGAGNHNELHIALEMDGPDDDGMNSSKSAKRAMEVDAT